jgi:uncharacterized protein YndB with AHSA1/START domain
MSRRIQMSDNSATTDRPAFVVTRAVKAPVDRVWQAWTDPDIVRRWWGPDGWTCPVANMDVAVGRTSLVAMRGPDGNDIYNRWTYTAVEPNARLEFEVTFASPDGTEAPPTTAGLPAEIPVPVRHVVTFDIDGETTTLSVAEFGYQPGPLLDMARLGQEQCMDKLVSAVADDTAAS